MLTGRPLALDEDQMAEICDRVADGETIRQISRSEHMPHAATIYRALAKQGSFCDQYAKAKEAQLTRWEDELVEIADDGSNDWMEREKEDGRIELALNSEHLNRSRLRVDTRKWIMSKRAPKKYGDRVMHAGDDDAPIKHTISLANLTDEQLRAISAIKIDADHS